MEIDALSRGQTILLQRLMAAHSMNDAAVHKLYQDLVQLSQEHPDELGSMGPSLEKCFGSINRQLTKAFGLEICTVSLDAHAQQRVHAVINQHADDIAKKCFLTTGSDNTAKKWNTTSRTPSEHEYIRQVLQCLVEKGLMMNHPAGSGSGDDDDDDAKDAAASYQATRVDLINLKNNLKAPYKLTMDGAEQCLRYLLDEHWLTVSSSNSSNSNSTTTNRGRRRSGREGLQSRLELGPRAFLELPQLLTEFGYPKEELPQTIFYRA